MTLTDETTILGPVPDGGGGDRSAGMVPESVIDELVAKVRAEGLELVGEGSLLAELTKKLLERGLAEELTEHVGYDRGDPAGRGSGNSRNGTTPKRVLTDVGPVDLDVPRDRNGTFEPILVPKGATRLAKFNENIVALYASGMTTRDIKKTLKRMYGVEVSPDLISRVTDGIVDELKDWQHRPLDGVYPIVYIDALVVKVRTSGTVINRAAYLAVGVDVEGRKHVLGVWLGDGGEGAKFWLTVLTELKARGLVDVLFVCCDGLKGLPDAIEATWPQSERADLRGAPHPGVEALLQLEGPQDHHRRPAADLHRRQRRGRRGCVGHLRARARGALPGHRGPVAGQLGAVHPVLGLPGGHPQDRVHHEHGRVGQLPDA